MAFAVLFKAIAIGYGEVFNKLLLLFGKVVKISAKPWQGNLKYHHL